MTIHPEYAYKLLTAADVAVMKDKGHTATAVDLADGFVHLSSKAQLSETAAKYFTGEQDCLLMEIRVAERDDVKWEPSRGGDLFPHIYGDLKETDAERTWLINIPSEGHPILPSDLK